MVFKNKFKNKKEVTTLKLRFGNLKTTKKKKQKTFKLDSNFTGEKPFLRP